MTLKTISISIAAIALLVLLSTQLFVWIPDIFIHRVIVLGEMKTDEGDQLKVTQEFVGDGYLTCFKHTDKTQKSWNTIFDGDAFKAWHAKLERTNQTVAIHVLNKTFFYDLDTHTMIDSQGNQRFVDHIAETQSETNKPISLTHESPSPPSSNPR